MTGIEDLYDKYFKDVYRFIYRLSGDKHTAEDITSETFLKAINSIDSFRGDSDIRTWLCQIAKNTYYSDIRKKSKIVESDKTTETIDSLDIESKMISKEESIIIHQIIHGLKEPYKEVFYLRVFGELSFNEIGHIFGKTDNWACVTYHRARKMIIKEMEDWK